MSWLRKLEPFHNLRKIDESKATKYRNFFRMAYFFSTSTLIFYTLYIVRSLDERRKKDEESKRLEAGFPVIEDESEAHAKLRKKGVEAGLLYKYTPEKGWHLEEYHRGEYMSRLQKKALEQAKEAQRKALAEGKELPPDAIILVDKSELSSRESDDKK